MLSSGTALYVDVERRKLIFLLLAHISTLPTPLINSPPTEYPVFNPPYLRRTAAVGYVGPISIWEGPFSDFCLALSPPLGRTPPFLPFLQGTFSHGRCQSFPPGQWRQRYDSPYLLFNLFPLERAIPPLTLTSLCRECSESRSIFLVHGNFRN